MDQMFECRENGKNGWREMFESERIRCLNAVNLNDDVKIFSKTLLQWLDGKVTDIEVLTGNVTVLFMTDEGVQCRKTLSRQHPHLIPISCITPGFGIATDFVASEGRRYQKEIHDAEIKGDGYPATEHAIAEHKRIANAERKRAANMKSYVFDPPACYR